jgi:AcrR family transcriptional regulator
MPVTTLTVPTRDRILNAATQLLAAGGRGAVSTRAVSAAAGVQPPTIYRTFGDMEGLLDAVATQAFEEYLQDKVRLLQTDDPVADLKASWDLHISFAMARPAFWSLIFENGGGGKASRARRRAEAMLRQMVSRVAAAGRLRMSVERASALMHAYAVGILSTQLALPENERDPRLAAAARDGVLAMITTDLPAPSADDSVPSKAVALRVALAEAAPAALSEAERTLLDEWLGKLADEV